MVGSCGQPYSPSVRNRVKQATSFFPGLCGSVAPGTEAETDILILIQLGGLGIVSFVTGIMMVAGSRITLSDRLLLEDALNLSTLKGLVRFLKFIFRGTFIIEIIGAICYSFVFVPDFGLIKGLWFSIFHAVSAFCNAGIDLLGALM